MCFSDSSFRSPAIRLAPETPKRLLEYFSDVNIFDRIK